MPLHFDINSAESHVRITGTGSLTMGAMIAVIQQVAEDPSFRSHFTVTLDLRAATYTAELSDGDALVAVLRQKKSDFQNRFAVVAPESLHFLARLYCALATMGGFDRIQCFTNIEEAHAWCRMHP